MAKKFNIQTGKFVDDSPEMPDADELKLVECEKAITELKIEIAENESETSKAILDNNMVILKQVDIMLKSHLASIEALVSNINVTIDSPLKDLHLKINSSLNENANRIERAILTEKIVTIHRDNKNLMDRVTVSPNLSNDLVS